MLNFKTLKPIYIFAAIVSFLIVTPSFGKESANNKETIYSASIRWDDEGAKETLLKNAPKWHADIIKSLFNAYQHPEQYQLSKVKDAKFYNIQFINAFWGPIDNPFNKYQRPAKAFVFVDELNHEPSTFYVAPLVQNLADGNYYVFDKNQSQPILLKDWVADIRHTHGYQTPIRFNICSSYGDLPNDLCSDKSYQGELKDIYGRFLERDARTKGLLRKEIPSAYRPIQEDFRSKVKKSLSATGSDNIYDNSITWQDVAARNLLLSTVITWPNYKTIVENFKKIRDIRFFDDEKSPHFSRRITWLYPDDGCWTRATAVIEGLFGPYHNVVNDFPRPSKLFAFGNLCVNTSNSKDGYVSWWYHTAPIVRDAETNQSYVLDPSVNPYQPMKVETWITEITSTSGACARSASKISTFNICNGFGVSPNDSCEGSVNYITEANSIFGQSSYRYFERNRQVELGRDADKVLGTSPPWLD